LVASLVASAAQGKIIVTAYIYCPGAKRGSENCRTGAEPSYEAALAQ